MTQRYTIAVVCGGGTEIDRTLLEGPLESLACNVSVLARANNLEINADISSAAVEQMFEIMTHMFPFVVVDLPRHHTTSSTAALNGADRVLLVSQLTVPHLRNAMRIYEYLLQLGADEEGVGVVLNRCNAHFEQIKPDEVEKQFGRPIFATIPNDYKRIGTARDLGHPIMSDAPNSPARLAIEELAKRLVGSHIDEENLRPASGGLFGRFRRRTSKV